MSLKKKQTIMVAVLLTSTGLAGCGTTSAPQKSATPKGPVTITWAASPITNLGLRKDLIRKFEASHPNIKVKLISQSTNTNTNRATLTTEISGGSSKPDVYMGDVIWPAQFAHAGLAKPLNGILPKSFFKRFAPGLITGASYKGKVYGAPFFMDAGFLYYRKDLLKKAGLSVPKTWTQLQKDSQILQKAKLVKYGYVWEGASYEGLTCDWMEFLSDSGGSVLNHSATKATIDSPAAVKALTFMRSLITSKVSPSAVTTFQEPQAMAAFDAGNAAFLRNWDYAWANSNNPATSSVAGKVGVAPLPTFSAHSYPGHSTIGGWNIYINPHSKYVSQDATFINWITGRTAQTYMATKFSEIPTNYAVQQSAAVQAKNPVLKIVHKVHLIARPSFTPQYSIISRDMYTNINSALSGTISPKTALKNASTGINKALSGSGL